MSALPRRYALALVFLSALAVCAVSMRYFMVSADAYPFEEQGAVYAANRTALLMHVAGGMLALLAGPVQFLRGLRERRPVLHRINGWIYALAVVSASASGLALSGHAFGPASNKAAFAMLAVLWFVATAAGIRAVIAGDLLQHRRWMIRSYALAFSGVTLRAETLLLAVAADMEFAAAYGIAAWLCWVGNLLVAEWLILRWPPARRVASSG